MSLKIGITGGIGSGKSTICKIFQVLGVPIFDADQETKKLMQSNARLKSSIQHAFGTETYDENGVLDRAYLASIVFKNEKKLAQLNAIVHPIAIQAAIDWAENQDAAYTLKEAALLFESGSYKYNDFNVLVVAPAEIRIQRVMERDHAAREQVIDRINKQWSDEQKKQLADFVIDNSGQVPVLPQVLSLHKQFLELATTVGKK